MTNLLQEFSVLKSRPETLSTLRTLSEIDCRDFQHFPVSHDEGQEMLKALKEVQQLRMEMAQLEAQMARQQQVAKEELDRTIALWRDEAARLKELTSLETRLAAVPWPRELGRVEPYYTGNRAALHELHSCLLGEGQWEEAKEMCGSLLDELPPIRSNSAAVGGGGPFAGSITGGVVGLEVAETNISNKSSGADPPLSSSSSSSRVSPRRVRVVNQARAVRGMGGVGKTELVKQFARSRRMCYAGGVFWVDASSAITVEKSFRHIAVDVLKMESLAESDTCKVSLGEVLVTVHAWLRANGGWLMIFDNADNLKELSSLCCVPDERARGHVLLTTRANDLMAVQCGGLVGAAPEARASLRGRARGCGERGRAVAVRPDGRGAGGAGSGAGAGGGLRAGEGMQLRGLQGRI